MFEGGLIVGMVSISVERHIVRTVSLATANANAI